MPTTFSNLFPCTTSLQVADVCVDGSMAQSACQPSSSDETNLSAHNDAAAQIYSSCYSGNSRFPYSLQPLKGSQSCFSCSVDGAYGDALPSKIYEVMFGGSKKGLDWKNNFQETLEEVFRQCGLNFGALMPVKYREFLHEASGYFMDAFRHIEMRDTLYEDVSDTETFRQLATRASEICLWTAGDIPNAHQRGKIVNSKILEKINAGASIDITRRNDIIADDKPAEMATELDAFYKAGKLKQLLVVVFDDSERCLVGADAAVSKWHASLADPPVLHKLFIRAERGKTKNEQWKFSCPAAANLRDMQAVMDEVAAKTPGLSRENTIVFLDFDGTLSDNALVRERQKRVAREELAIASYGVALLFVDRFVEKTSRKETLHKIYARFNALFEINGPLEVPPGDASLTPLDASHAAIEALVQSAETKLHKCAATGDPSALDLSHEIRSLRNILVYANVSKEDARLIQWILANAFTYLNYDDLALDLMEEIQEGDAPLFRNYLVCCLKNKLYGRIVDYVENHPAILVRTSSAARAHIASAYIQAACDERDQSRNEYLANKGQQLFDDAMSEDAALAVEERDLGTNALYDDFSTAQMFFIQDRSQRHVDGDEIKQSMTEIFNTVLKVWDVYERLLDQDATIADREKSFGRRYAMAATKALLHTPVLTDVAVAHALLKRAFKVMTFITRHPVDLHTKRFFAWQIADFIKHVERIDPSHDGKNLREKLERFAYGASFDRPFESAISNGDYELAIEIACHKTYDHLITDLISLYQRQTPIALTGIRVLEIPAGARPTDSAHFEQIAAERGQSQGIVTIQDMIEPYRTALDRSKEDCLAYLQGIAPEGAVIDGRVKTASSMLLKMLMEGKDRLTQITDALGFRVLTETEEEMRALYARIRSDMQPNIIKEWITVDKPTSHLYRSMDITGHHPTTGARMQVQVRTKRMHDDFFFEPSNEQNYKIESGKNLLQAFRNNPSLYLHLMGRILNNLYEASQALRNGPGEVSIEATIGAYDLEPSAARHLMLVRK